MRDPALDVVDNCLVNSLHYEPLLAAIHAGKHVFSDKPLTIAVSEAEHLLAEAERAGVAHGIVQNMRFQGGPTVARELLAAGELGRIFHARVTWGYMVPKRVTNRPTWFFKQELAGGGIVHDMMGHFFDLLRHLLEPSCGPIASVYCATDRGFDEREEPDGTPFPVAVEDTCSVVLRFRSGAIGDVFASWIRRKHEEVPFVEIDGEAGSVAFSFNDLRFQSQERTPSFTYDPTRVQAAFGEGWEHRGPPPGPVRVAAGAFSARYRDRGDRQARLARRGTEPTPDRGGLPLGSRAARDRGQCRQRAADYDRLILDDGGLG